ncbi:MAG: MATE family efflux transporter [Oscillospiraceae bacterium]|nr:MATE family efflux transporter [Oscillospiraceae bacterium]
MLNKYFGDKAFWQTTLSLALPIAVQNLLSCSFTLMDTVMVGQLGDVSLSGTGMACQWSWLMTLVFFGLSSGTAMFVSQYWGVGDKKSIRRVFGMTVLISVSVSVVFMLAATLIPEHIVGIFNSDPGVISEGAAYLRILAFSFPATALSISMSIVLRSTENVKLPMYASGIASATDVVLNYVMIFGALGFPSMGVRGAALSTVISTWMSPLIMFVVSKKQNNILIGPFKELFGFNRGMVTEYVRKASPVILNEGMWGLGTVMFNVIFGRLGYEQYAAVAIQKTAFDFSFIFFAGLCSACCVIVGKSIGAGRLYESYAHARRFAALVPCFSIVVGGVLVLLRHPFAGLFNLNGNITETTLQSAVGIMAISGFELALRNIPFIQIVGIFRSGGDTAVGMRYDFICLWLISLPLTALAAFVLKWPFAAVFATMLLAEDVLKSVLCVRYFRSRKWIMPVTEEGKAALAN